MEESITKKVSVIIPTIREKVITLESLKDIKENIEVVIVRDIWRNVSKARNIGAKFSKGDILVFMDDDIAFKPCFFTSALKSVDDGKVLWLDPPFICFITRKNFEDVDGFDERIKPQMAEPVELKKALLRRGIKIVELDGEEVTHYGGVYNKEKYWLNQKNLLYVTLKYEKKKIYKHFLTKNPIRFIKILSFLLEWLIILSFNKKRSSLKDNLEENVLKNSIIVLGNNN